MSTQPRVVEIDCREARRELVNYLEDDLGPELRKELERHLAHCRHCTALYDGMRNVVRLLANDVVIELPKGFGERLQKKLEEQIQAGFRASLHC